MKSYKFNGQIFTYVALAAIASGDVVIQGEYVGIAIADAAIGEEVECQRTGVVELPKEAALVIVQGEKAYWDGSEVDNKPADDGQNDEIGIFHKSELSGSDNAQVLLKGGAAAFN